MSLNKIKKLFLALMLLFCFSKGYSQYIQVDDSYTAQQLVEVFIGQQNLDCIEIYNPSVTGYNFGGGQLSYGYFDGSSSSFEMNNGVLLSSGKARSAIGPNNNILSEGPAGNAWPGDQDLEVAIALGYTINATVLEFDFVSYSNHVSFEYIFASEQYLTQISSQSQCGYTDGFAFLIKKANTFDDYTNLAVIPGTDTPVTVNTVRGEGVCPSANEQYFGSFNGSNHPINFNGQTVTMIAETAIEPGQMYHIKLVIADQGNNLYDSAVFLKGGSFGNGTKDLGPNRLIASGNPICEGETITLNATTDQAESYQWYKDGNAIVNETSANYTVTDPGLYEVLIGFGSGGCSIKGDIKIEYVQKPQPVNTSLTQCEFNSSDLVYDLMTAQYLIMGSNAQDYSYSFYTNYNNALSGQNPIQNPYQFTATTDNQVIFVRVVNEFGCYAVSELMLSSINSALNNPDDIEKCSQGETGTIFDLTVNQDQILAQVPSGTILRFYPTLNDAISNINSITNLVNYQITQNTTIYVKLLQDANCLGIVWFDLIIRDFIINTNDQNIFICDGVAQQISAPSGYFNYLWNDGQTTESIDVDQAGIYSVTFSNQYGCQASINYVVSASSAPVITSVDVVDLTNGTNSVRINVDGLGDYEFSLNGIQYQNSNYFENVNTGNYMVFARDKNGCGSATDQIFVLSYPKFFTPNGDGFNDYWRIDSLAIKDPSAYIEVFDRYGRLIKSFRASQIGWDGTYSDKHLPATDYWFVIHLDGRKVRGHFSLLR